MKKLITTLALLSLLTAPVAKALDVHNPVGLWRGIPYLSDWGQRWLTNQSGTGAAAFWLGDTNAALSFWSFMQPYAYAQNTNALSAQQQAALNSLITGVLISDFDSRQHNVTNVNTVGARSFSEIVASVISVANTPRQLGPYGGLLQTSMNGRYTYFSDCSASGGAVPTLNNNNVLGQFVFSGAPVWNYVGQKPPIIGLTMATNAALYYSTIPSDGYFFYPAYLALDKGSTNFCLYTVSVDFNGNFQAAILYTTDPNIGTNYVWGGFPNLSINGWVYNAGSGFTAAWTASNHAPQLTVSGNLAMYTTSLDLSNNLVITPSSLSTSNLLAPNLNSTWNNVTGTVVSATGGLVGNGSALTGITVSQVSGAVPNTDASYLSIPALTSTANNALSTANTASSTATANSTAITTLTARLNYGTNTVAAANTASYTWLQPAFAFNTPYVNPSGRRATLFVDIQYTNVTGFQLQNTAAGWTWPFTNMFSGQRSDLFTLPMSPGDTVQITTNSYSAMIRSSWLREE